MENNIEVMKKSDSESGVDNASLHDAIDFFHQLSLGKQRCDQEVFDTIVAIDAAIESCALSPKAIIAARKMYGDMVESMHTVNLCVINVIADDTAPIENEVIPDGLAIAQKDFLDKRASFVGLKKSLQVRRYVY